MGIYGYVFNVQMSKCAYACLPGVRVQI